MTTRREKEIEWNYRWGDLARYNDEVAHGVVHTAEYDAHMAEMQGRYADSLLLEDQR